MEDVAGANNELRQLEAYIDISDPSQVIGYSDVLEQTDMRVKFNNLLDLSLIILKSQAKQPKDADSNKCSMNACSGVIKKRSIEAQTEPEPKQPVYLESIHLQMSTSSSVDIDKCDGSERPDTNAYSLRDELRKKKEENLSLIKSLQAARAELDALQRKISESMMKMSGVNEENSKLRESISKNKSARIIELNAQKSEIEESAARKYEELIQKERRRSQDEKSEIERSLRETINEYRGMISTMNNESASKDYGQLCRNLTDLQHENDNLRKENGSICERATNAEGTCKDMHESLRKMVLQNKKLKLIIFKEREDFSSRLRALKEEQKRSDCLIEAKESAIIKLKADIDDARRYYESREAEVSKALSDALECEKPEGKSHGFLGERRYKREPKQRSERRTQLDFGFDSLEREIDNLERNFG